MKCHELIEYLSGFGRDENVTALILNLETWQAYPTGVHQCISDAGIPVLLFELGESHPMDDMVEEEHHAD